MTDSRVGRLTLLLAALCAALVYLPRLGAPFMWDDRPFLVDIPAYDHRLPPSFYASPAYFPATGEITWRPLSSFSYDAMISTFGRRPLPLRVISFALHIFVCVLLAMLVSALGLGSEVALTAAALFLVTPVHIETLMTVTFNKEILSTLGILGLLVSHLRRRPWLGAASLTFACLAKESGLVGLPLVFLLDLLHGGASELRRRTREYGAYVFIAVSYLFLRFGPLKGPGGEADLSALLPWTERLYYGAHAFVSSARVMLAPFGLRIEYFALPASSPFVYMSWFCGACVLLAAVLALAARARRQKPALAFFLLLPLPALFLVSNIIPVAVLSLRLMAERWLYLPAIGVCAALAILLRGKPGRARLLIVVWAALGLSRMRDWSSETALWSSLVRVYPWSAKAVEGDGEALYREGRTPEALAAFTEGRRLRETHEDLVLAHYVPLAPPGTIGFESASLRRWLGLCRLRLGDERAALADFEAASALQPSDGFTYRVLAYENAKLGDFSAARAWLDKGLALAPTDEFLLRLKPGVQKKRLSFSARFD